MFPEPSSSSNLANKLYVGRPPLMNPKSSSRATLTRARTPDRQHDVDALPTWTPLHVSNTGINASESSERSRSTTPTPRHKAKPDTRTIVARRGRPPGRPAKNASPSYQPTTPATRPEESWAENLAAAMAQAYGPPPSASRLRRKAPKTSIPHTDVYREGKGKGRAREESTDIDIIDLVSDDELPLKKPAARPQSSSPEIPHPPLPREVIEVDDWVDEDEGEPPRTSSPSPSRVAGPTQRPYLGPPLSFSPRP